jgi:predicted RNase H-like HicB family nuclease
VLLYPQGGQFCAVLLYTGLEYTSGKVLQTKMQLRIEVELEDDGRYIAEAPDLPGVLVYGRTSQEAVRRAKALALRVIADRLEQGEAAPEIS